MNARSVLAFACVAILATPVALKSQGLEGVTAGDRVRLTAPAIGVVKRQTFTLVGVTADSITLSPVGQDITIDCAIADLSSLQAHRGQKRATWRGLVIVGTTGAAIGILAGLVDGSDPPDELFGMSAGEKALIGGVALGVLGGAVGALLGSTAKVDRWEKVPLIQVRVAPSDIVARGFAVSASLRL